MTFEFYGFEPGSTGSESSKALVRLWPDDDSLAADFSRAEAKARVEAKFRELIADPANSDYSIVVISPTVGGNIVAVEYPSPISPRTAEQHGRQSRWLEWIVDPSLDVPKPGPKA